MTLDPSAILTVARREFKQIASMRSFWVSLLLFPMALALAPILTNVLADDEATRIVLIDRADSSTGAALRDRIDAEAQLDELRALSTYVRRHELESADPVAPWAQHDRPFGLADVAAYRAAGGLDGALEKISQVAPPEIPEFSPPDLDYELVEPGAMLADATPDQIEEERSTIFDSEDDAAPDTIILLEENYDSEPVVRLWSNEQPSAYFLSIIQETTTQQLRTRLLAERGVDAGAQAMIAASAPALAISTPKPGSGARQTYFVRSILPLATAYILLMSIILSGNWMVQGSVEERGNKLIESVLACIRPEELMYGKLLGIVAIGLSMTAVWVACAVAAALATQGAIADFIRPALAPVSDPIVIAAIIYFFIAGYLMLSVLFLAVGAMTDSMNEAQGFMMPLMLIILMPVMFLMQAIISGGVSPAIEVMTWIPILTPFAVLSQMGLGIETWKLLGTAVLLAAFIALEIWLLGRLFRASLLAQGQKGSLKQLVSRFRDVRD